MRGFEKVSSALGKDNILLPSRSTKGSAGYDFYSPDDLLIPAKGEVIIKTGIKAYMNPDEVLFLFPRSSLGIKKSLMLKNTIGVIDSDYYNNEDNEGEILASFYNFSDQDVEIKKSTKVFQGVFQKILLADDDSQTDSRKGGIGSTGE